MAAAVMPADDPLIASAEGAGQAPAFRGLAYALFEDFQLEDYGNRIPSLTFEVEADDGPIPIGEIAADLTGRLVTGAATPAPVGYAATGDSVRDAIAALADVVPLSLADDGSGLRLATPGGEAAMLAKAEETERRSIVRRALDSVPDEIGITYYDPARDYQAGLQRAAAEGGPGRNAERLSLPAAFSAGAAKGLAEYRLAMLRAGRASVKAAYDWRRADLRPGALARIEGLGGAWKVSRWTLGAMRTSIELTGVPGGSPVAADADAGRPASADDLIQGPTTLRLRDLPLGTPASGTPMLFAFAAGDDAGWRRADLIATFDDGASWLPVGRAGPATMGTALTALAARPSTLFDTESALEVELLSETMWLEGASDAALAGGANLALIGEELIQFGRAEWIAPRRFRLSRLLRGQGGSEGAMAAPLAAGAPFVLLDGNVVTIASGLGALERNLQLRVVAADRDHGDPTALALTATPQATALMPLTPVHVKATRDGSGVTFTWIRRTRIDGDSWVGEVPLGEASEQYALDILSGVSVVRTLTTVAPSVLYAAADEFADFGAVQSVLHVRVAQVSATVGRGFAADVTLTL